MFRQRAVATVAFAAALVAPMSAGDQHLVAPVGGDFAEIQQAIDAASDGDVIVVDPTWLYYERFTVEGKSLTIVSASPHSPVRMRTHDGGLATNDVVTVRHLTAGQVVTLDGFRISSYELPPLPLASLGIESCRGSVRIQNCQIASSEVYDGGVLATPAVRVEDSANVTFQGCRIWGFVGGCAYDPVYGDPVWCPLTSTKAAVEVDGPTTRVAFFDCDVLGAVGGTPPQSSSAYLPWNGYDGGAALSVTDAYVFASGTAFIGGDGGDGGRTAVFQAPAPGGDGGDGGHGLELSGATFEFLGCTIVAGEGGTGGECWDWGTNTSCAGQHGYGPDGVDGIPILGCCYHPRGGDVKSVTARALFEADFPAVLTLDGEPGDFVLLLASDRGAFVEATGRQGPLLLDEPTLVPGSLGVVPPSGRLRLEVDLPPFSGADSTATTLLQPVFIDPMREVALAPPTTIVRSRPFVAPWSLCSNHHGTLTTPDHPAASAGLSPGFDFTGAASSSTAVAYYGFEGTTNIVGFGNCIVGQTFRAAPPFATDAQGAASFQVDWSGAPFASGAGALSPGDAFLIQVVVLAPGGIEWTNALSLVLRP